MIPVILWAMAVAQGPLPADSLRAHLYVQAELTWYGTGPVQDLSNRLVRVAAIRQLGFGGTRLPIEWPRVEAVRGRRDWSRIDSAVAELSADSLAAYGVITYSPPWAVPDTLRHRPRIAAHRPVVDGSAAEGDTAFAAFAAAAARRYRGRIDRWEIWNEENHPAFWMNVVDGVNHGADPTDYASLFALARDSIEAANPHAEVAVGGLTSMNGIPAHPRDPLDPARPLPAYTPAAFIRGIVAAGVRPKYVGIHPYSTVPPMESVPGIGVVFPNIVVDSVLSALDDLRLQNTQVWVTEWGINLTTGMTQAEVDAWMKTALSTLLCRPRIALVTIHAITDANDKEHFALLGAAGKVTMNGVALSHFLSQWRGC